MQKYRKIHTYIHIGRQADTTPRIQPCGHRQPYRPTDRHTDSQTHKKADRLPGRKDPAKNKSMTTQTDRQTANQTDRQAPRQRDRKADIQPGRQTDITPQIKH